MQSYIFLGQSILHHFFVNSIDLSNTGASAKAYRSKSLPLCVGKKGRMLIVKEFPRIRSPCPFSGSKRRRMQFNTDSSPGLSGSSETCLLCVVFYAISNPVLFTKSIKGESSLFINLPFPTRKGSIFEFTFLVKLQILPVK